MRTNKGHIQLDIIAWACAGCPKLVALRLQGPQSEPLSEEIVADIGTEPPRSLKYLCWVVQGAPTTYLLQRWEREGKEITSLVKIPLLRVKATDKWF